MWGWICTDVSGTNTQDDYSLFKLRIPQMVCGYLQTDRLVQLMRDIADYHEHNTRDEQSEQRFRREAKSLFKGEHSIYGPRVEYRGNTTIHTVHEKNHSIPVIWHRDNWTHTNADTKIPHFYDMWRFDDMYSDVVFGLRLSALRGMMTLINMLHVTDPGL